ncbi:helix-turn-helix transcriptional regulator [Saccharothrix longispora]|uniref:helix-turn-helix domain-containing protein n=1 Tax=Saccharothrix longispora TaxID=33920 RepID=UPI0028FD40BB|nr:helix-turn-helix transcriptional regulator [Saccharothrix longispora]MDU0289207.1 helix-turn-helix transcriptional regulator [Saccharothrix longispora]
MTVVGEEVEAAGEVGRRMTRRRPARRALYHVVLGAHLRKLRERRGVSIARIAEHFDVSQALLIKVENGRRGPSPASLAMYCEVLGLPMLDLLADVAELHREMVDPFDPLLRTALTPDMRALDGLALYAGIPRRHMPEVLHQRSNRAEQQPRGHGGGRGRVD